MKANHLLQILLAGLLTLQVCPKSAAAFITVTGCASDCSASAAGSSPHQSSSLDLSATIAESNYSPNDGSTSEAAQSITFDGSTFSGNGRIRTRAGLYAITSVSAETSVYITFTNDSPAHYQFVSDFVTQGGTGGEVTFNGIANSAGVVFASGTIRQGYTYTLHAANSDPASGDPCSGTWSYALQLTPTNVPVRFTTAQKSAFYTDYKAAMSVATALINLALKAPTISMYLDLLDAANAQYTAAQNYYADFLDPLDTNYTVLAQVTLPAVTLLTTGGGVTQAAANDYNAWLTNLSETAGYSTARTTSLNRAQGAAAAENAYWETQQMNAVVQFEAQLAVFLDQEPALRSNVVAQFEADGFPTITVTTNDATDLQMEIATNGFPTNLVEGLMELGVDAQTITNMQNWLLTQDPGSLTGSFPNSLANTNLDSASQTLAAYLRDASLMLIYASLLPSGQFRFELPMEPGYSYTIQFNQNLTHSSGWTTIYSNSATATLLSFTNTPPPNAQPGFYRATHN